MKFLTITIVASIAYLTGTALAAPTVTVATQPESSLDVNQSVTTAPPISPDVGVAKVSLIAALSAANDLSKAAIQTTTIINDLEEMASLIQSEFLSPEIRTQIATAILDLIQPLNSFLTGASGLGFTEEAVNSALVSTFKVLDSVAAILKNQGADEALEKVENIKPVLTTLISLVIQIASDSSTQNYAGIVLVALAGILSLVSEVRSLVTTGTALVTTTTNTF